MPFDAKESNFADVSIYDVYPYKFENEAYYVHIDGRDYVGILPVEETGFLKKSFDICMSKLGTPLSVVVKQFDYKNKKLYLSRKAAMDLAWNTKLKYLPAGSVIQGVVASIQDHYAFVDIGAGNAFLMPIQYAARNITHSMRERFYKGQRILCVIKEISPEKRHVILSHKELLGTWEENSRKFLPGTYTEGIIRDVTSGAIFVEIAPNLFGLSEVQDMELKYGDHVLVKILGIRPAIMKMNLKVEKVMSVHKYNQREYCYFYQGGGYIPSWNYSPPYAPKEKEIKTVFQKEE